MKYALQTTVSPAKTRNEIEALLMKYGATGFAYASEGEMALIGFSIQGRTVRFVLPLPAFDDYKLTPSRMRRTQVQQDNAHAQAVRSAWRSLLLITKAKLEAVEQGISTLEREFLPDLVMPNNQTFGQWALPQVVRAIESNTMPSLPAALGGRSE